MFRTILIIFSQFLLKWKEVIFVGWGSIWHDSTCRMLFLKRVWHEKLGVTSKIILLEGMYGWKINLGRMSFKEFFYHMGAKCFVNIV